MDQNRTAPQQAAEMDFSNAPGGEFSLDSLFPNPEVPQAQPQAAEPPSQPVEPQVFLKTSTGTVYKTAEDATKGIEHKDALISELRQFAIEKTGIDPVTKKQVSQPQQPQGQPRELNYAENPQQYYNDLSEAVAKEDRLRYAQVQQKFLYDTTAAPILPLITDMARDRAVYSVAAEIPQFREFYNSDSFKQGLNDLPLLKQAIENSESSVGGLQQLPELYKIAYFALQGRRVPEVVQAAVSQPAPVQTQSARPTQAPSTLTPPQTPAKPSSMATSEGRKAIIERFQNAGLSDLPLESFR